MSKQPEQVLGIDLGTSGLKIVLMDATGAVLAIEKENLQVMRPQPGWSEQSPLAWWQALEQAMARLAARHPLSAVQALGFSGQMHGSVLLDRNHEVIRPAILWNDGRCQAECLALEAQVPALAAITGNRAMAGFTAPKLLWLRQHEPAAFRRIAHIMLPKDYLVWRLTGALVSDYSDASGTLWLDVAKRQWSDEMIHACGLQCEQLPALHDGNQIIGCLDARLAARWGMGEVAVVAGAGDNAAGALGAGLVNSGQAMLSLGTSGVSFLLTDDYHASADSGLHCFCHTLAGQWSLMAVTLNAASCLQWAASLLSCKDVPALIALAASSAAQPPLLFLPYLSGERTPHNNPAARGVFFGLDHLHRREEMARAVLEGVSFALAEGLESINHSSPLPESIQLIGGGARSAWWRQLLADVSGRCLNFYDDGDVGPARGAAILALCGLNGSDRPPRFSHQPVLIQSHQPVAGSRERYRDARQRFQQLYQTLRPLFNLEEAK